MYKCLSLVAEHLSRVIRIVIEVALAKDCPIDFVKAFQIGKIMSKDRNSVLICEDSCDACISNFFETRNNGHDL